MKKFALLFVLLAACKGSPASNDVKASQADCEQTFGHCVNQCHHTTSSSSESFDCIEACKTSNKKCGK